MLRPMGDTLMNGTELEETLVAWLLALCLPKRSLQNGELLMFHLWRIRHQTIVNNWVQRAGYAARLVVQDYSDEL